MKFVTKTLGSYELGPKKISTSNQGNDFPRLSMCYLRLIIEHTTLVI